MKIRRILITDYKSDFLTNDFEKIEDLLTREFLNYFWKLLLLKNNYTDWTIFSSGVLSRFDLYYSRQKTIRDETYVKEFWSNCHDKLILTNKKVNFEKNSKGFLLKIGNRKSNHYSRIYKGKNFLKFEHEMKGRFLQKYHTLLVQNRLKEFKYHLTHYFLYRFGKRLPLNYSSTDWVVIKLRPIRKQSIPQFFLNS